MKEFMESKWVVRAIHFIWVLYAILVVAMIVGSASLREAWAWLLVLFWFGSYVLYAVFQRETQKAVTEALEGWGESLKGWNHTFEEFKKLKEEIDQYKLKYEPEPKPDTIMGKHGKRKIS